MSARLSWGWLRGFFEGKSDMIKPIDIKDSVNAIQAYVRLIERRIKDKEVLRMGKKVLLRMQVLKQQVGEVYYDQDRKAD